MCSEMGGRTEKHLMENLILVKPAISKDLISPAESKLAGTLPELRPRSAYNDSGFPLGRDLLPMYVCIR